MKSKQRGQTSIEYLLVLGVSIVIGLRFFSVMENYLLNNPNSVMNRYLGGYTRILGTGPNASEARFKTFSFPK